MHKHGHSIWPINSDDISWAAAAWEVYSVTGDKSFLKWAYNVIKNTSAEDYDINADQVTGLMHGGVQYSFSESQFYPNWMEYKDIYETVSLTSNVLYEHAFEILNDMGDELDVSNNYGEKAQNLKDAINEALWNERKGYYNQYTYLAAYPVRSPGIDNFGQALSVIWNIADDNRAENLIMKTPITNFGVPTASPAYSSLDRINLSEIMSPLMQAFWNLAAAKTENENMLRHGLGALYRGQALTCCNKGGYNTFTGVQLGNVEGDMGSASGNVAMVFRVYAGMTFLPNGVEFNPMVPVFLTGKKEIKNFKYRQATLDITIEGTGNVIDKFTIDGKETHDNFINGAITGRHAIVITMTNNNHAPQIITKGNNEFCIPTTPVAEWLNDSTRILNYNNDNTYRMVVNGQLRYTIGDTTFTRNDNKEQFSINSVVEIGKYALSYLSKPYFVMPHVAVLPVSQFATAGTSLLTSPKAKNAVETSTGKNGEITIKYVAPQGGDYFFDVRYSNGRSSNTCPLLSVTVNSHHQGTLVMPCRGESEWLNAGMSNLVQLQLLKGENTIVIKRIGNTDDPVLLHYARIIKK